LRLRDDPNSNSNESINMVTPCQGFRPSGHRVLFLSLVAHRFDLLHCFTKCLDSNDIYLTDLILKRSPFLLFSSPSDGRRHKLEMRANVTLNPLYTAMLLAMSG
jgi:hypothetical protein